MHIHLRVYHTQIQEFSPEVSPGSTCRKELWQRFLVITLFKNKVIIFQDSRGGGPTFSEGGGGSIAIFYRKL